jgi:UDP-glucose 4-epimerase
MKRVFITGAAGLIGSTLCHYFLHHNYEVAGIDSLVGGYKSNLPEENRNFWFYKEDILNQDFVNRVFQVFKPHIVIHCAALAHEGLSVFSPKLITESIYTGTISVASAAIANNTGLFINHSSMARYGDIGVPFRETDVPRPVDPYGLAKLHAEEQLNLLSSIHGMKVFHVVPHNVCGPGQNFTDPYRNVMSIFANLTLQGKPVYIYGDGSQKRSFSHVNDCVKAISRLVDKQAEIPNGSIYNIGPEEGTEISIVELAQQVGRFCNHQPQIKYLPARPQEVKNAWVSTEKAEYDLDYVADYSTTETVQDTVQWIRTQPLQPFKYTLPLEIVNQRTPEAWTGHLFNKG